MPTAPSVDRIGYLKAVVVLVIFTGCSGGPSEPEAEERPWYDPFFAEEVQLIRDECMREAGFDPGEPGNHWRGGGRFLPALPEGQEVARSAAMERCRKQVSEQVQFPDYNEDVYSEMYDLYQWTQNCLIENGLATVEPPTKDRWVEDAQTTLVWHPYDAIDGAFEILAPGADHSPQAIARVAEVARIAEICPAAHHAIVARMIEEGIDPP